MVVESTGIKGIGVGGGGGAPMMQRWMRETMCEEPYNNIGAITEVKCARNTEAKAVNGITRGGTAWSCHGTAGSRCSEHQENATR